MKTTFRSFIALPITTIFLAACSQSSPPLPATPSPSPTSTACARGGCSGQLCLEANLVDQVVTTCEYQAQYACYQNAVCERQTNGACGWTQTQQLQSCLEKAASVKSPILPQ